MSNDRNKCGATFVGRDGETVKCDRDGARRHVAHRAADGTTAVRVPGGAVITKPRNK
ncbi:hypothetical protein Acsp04_60860 [Actinomadura sp. NBRC 104425]|uniref:hypothetical protein n=1 Tax=Actinomadura sp. NBRC 104425 TaxID=3032204 RepID=UPI00249FFC54|nr:hypothetical protein [Actinomadura sp. NBRC 104425]GLZ15851.1 hypothetical protein Acsp04_60860 [Actinomadura sp. NBRC 104425]